MADLNNPPLNVQPQGLLDFLQLKNGGQYPQTLGNVLSPTIDLYQHFLSTNAIFHSVAQAPGNWPAIAGNAFVMMPNIVQWWRYVVSAGIEFVSANALDRAFVKIMVVRAGGAGRYVAPIGSNAGRQILAGGTIQDDYHLAHPGNDTLHGSTRDLWLPPGASLLAYMQAGSVNTAGAATAGGHVYYVDLRA